MSTLTKPRSVPEPVAVAVTDDTLSVDLADGRTIAVPLDWFPRLRHGTVKERANFELSFAGIHWPQLDEDISVEGLLNGEKSGESPKSIQRWLDFRARGEKVPVKVLPLPGWAKTALDKDVKAGSKRKK
jgi:Protein of unknown function (DUF2442)